MSDQARFKDYHYEIRAFGYRTILVAFVVLLLFFLLIGRYYYLQVMNHQKYVTAADNNRILVQTVSPKRGLIFDRNKKILADNRASYTLMIVPERAKNIDETIAELRKLVTIDDRDIESFLNAKAKRRSPYQPVPIRYQLEEREIALIAVNENRLPGVSVEAQLVRHYPRNELFAHVVGYMGKISQADIEKFTDEERERYKDSHLIGKTGIESYYEDTLYGENGFLHVEINARNRILRTLERKPSVPGRDLQLHLDSQLQERALELMRGKRGAVVMMDIKTGGILALVSTPTYDPNPFVTGISYKDYRELNENPDKPQLNRALQGRYPPASTVKPMFGLAGLKYGFTTAEFRYFDPGYYQIDNDERKYRDWKRGGHGWVDVHKSIVQSSDTYFYQLAHKMGVDNMHKIGLEFGLGQIVGIDLPGENKGLWPSRQWKEINRGRHWFPGDSINFGIGQGFSSATPLQLAVMVSTIANKGTRMKPQIVKAIGGVPIEPEVAFQVQATEEHWRVIFEAMHDVVHAKNGTAKRVSKDIAYEMAGKTGTAQVVGIPQNERYDSDALKERQRDHGLYVGFAPYEKPQVAISVFVENGESGSGAAAPIARAMFDTYLLDMGNLEQPLEQASAP